MVYSEFAFDCSKKVLNVTETNFDICPIGTRESWAFQVISPWVKFLKAESVKRDKSPVSIPDIHFCIANLSLNIGKLRDLRKRRAVVKSRSTNKANLQKTIQYPQLFSNVARTNATTGAMEACCFTFNSLTVG